MIKNNMSGCIRAVFNTDLKTNIYSVILSFKEEEDIKIDCSFKYYSELLTEALNTKGCEIDILSYKKLLRIRAAEFYDFILFEKNEYGRISYQQVYTKDIFPKIDIKDNNPAILQNKIKKIVYPLYNYRNAFEITKKVIKGEQSMELLVNFVNNWADKDLDGLIFPSSIKDPKKLLDSVLRVLDLSELPEND